MSKQQQPTQFAKGDKVRDVYTGQVYTVKRSYWQNYAGEGDYTVEFEPTAEQPTPWNKSRNLQAVAVPPAGVQLKAGDRVRVHGFIMLKGLDAGDYRVAYQYNHATYGPVYSFAKPKGRRILCSFPTCKIDPWLNQGVSQFNYIEVL